VIKMGNLKKLEEIPPGSMNRIVIILMVIVLIFIGVSHYFKLQNITAALIALLGILFGSLVVGNSITQSRSKTVENELMRSNIDIINDCIANKKLEIEMYNAEFVTNINASNPAQKLEINTASVTAKNAVTEYNKYCEDLKNENKEDEGSIIDKTFKVALERLKDLVKPKNQKSEDRVSHVGNDKVRLTRDFIVGIAAGFVSGLMVLAEQILMVEKHAHPVATIVIVWAVGFVVAVVVLKVLQLLFLRDP
jgi:c-di-AMP phosphodiesterase-like protein